MSSRLSRILATMGEGVAMVVGTASGLALGFMLAIVIWNLA